MLKYLNNHEIAVFTVCEQIIETSSWQWDEAKIVRHGVKMTVASNEILQFELKLSLNNMLSGPDLEIWKGAGVSARVLTNEARCELFEAIVSVITTLPHLAWRGLVQTQI